MGDRKAGDLREEQDTGGASSNGLVRMNQEKSETSEGGSRVSKGVEAFSLTLNDDSPDSNLSSEEGEWWDDIPRWKRPLRRPPSGRVKARKMEGGNVWVDKPEFDVPPEHPADLWAVLGGDDIPIPADMEDEPMSPTNFSECQDLEYHAEIGIHKSHPEVWFCGGYFACFECSRIAQNEAKNNLTKTCRGREHTPRGSESAVNRFKKGLHPYGKKPGQSNGAWPNGESQPRPTRLLKGELIQPGGKVGGS